MPKKYTEEELLLELERLEKELERSPSAQDMTEHGNYGENTYLRRFGSWNNSLEKAGIEINKGYYVSGDKLENELIRISGKDECRNPPSASDMDKYGKYSSTLFLNKYGSWNDALEYFGFDVVFHQNITQEELVEEIYRVSEERFCGKAPVCEAMGEYTNYGQSTFIRAFGTWNDALERCGFALNKYRDGESRCYDYGPSWHQQRKKARKRDSYSCRVCSIEESDLGLIPDIHHIEPSKHWNVEEEHERMNDLSNLVSLCRPCHQKLEGKWQDTSPEEFARKGREFLNLKFDESGEGERSLMEY